MPELFWNSLFNLQHIFLFTFGTAVLELIPSSPSKLAVHVSIQNPATIFLFEKGLSLLKSQKKENEI